MDVLKYDNFGVDGIYACGYWAWLVGGGCVLALFWGSSIPTSLFIFKSDCFIYRYPHNNELLLFPTSLVLALFWAAASLLLCSFFKCFFGLVSVLFCNI